MLNILGDLFNLIFFAPLTNLLVFYYKIFEAIHLPGAFGFALMLLTITLGLLLWKISSSPIKFSQKIAEIKPEIDELKIKHKDDKMAFQKAQAELYKKHGLNPLSGCLPVLIQLPIYPAIYQIITDIFPSTGGSLDKIQSVLYYHWQLPAHVDPYFLGINLTSKPADFSRDGFFLLAIPLLTVVLTFVYSLMTMPAKPLKHYSTDSPKETKEKEGVEDSMEAMQTQMVYFMPIMVGFISFNFPVALAIYWNTYTIVGIVQRYLIGGLGEFATFLKKIKGYAGKIK